MINAIVDEMPSWDCTYFPDYSFPNMPSHMSKSNPRIDVITAAAPAQRMFLSGLSHIFT